MTSTWWSGSRTTAGRSRPGQLTIAGSLTPPSFKPPLPPEKGVFEQGGLAPASFARSAAGRAPVANMALVGPPLSDVKKISVSSRMFFRSSAATIRPTCRSREVIMAA